MPIKLTDLDPEIIVPLESFGFSAEEIARALATTQ